MESLKIHRETCYKCGYEGYDPDDVVSKRRRCPKCGAKKIHTLNQAPLSEGDLPSKERSEKVDLQGEVGVQKDD